MGKGSTRSQSSSVCCLDEACSQAGASVGQMEQWACGMWLGSSAAALPASSKDRASACSVVCVATYFLKPMQVCWVSALVSIREATLRGENLNKLNPDLSCRSVCRPHRNRFIKTGESVISHLHDSMEGLTLQCSCYLLRNNLHLIVSSDMAWKVELTLVTALI